MTSTITGASGASVPDFIEGYQAEARSRNVELELAASTDRVIVLRASHKRSGTLTAGFSVAATAQALFSDLRAGTSLTLADTSVPYVNMTFILAAEGRASIRLSASRRVWLVVFDYTEI